MTIPEPPTAELNSNLDFVVKVEPPNDNTDGQGCACGHAVAAHKQLTGAGVSTPTWQCQHCACTRGSATRVPSTR